MQYLTDMFDLDNSVPASVPALAEDILQLSRRAARSLLGYLGAPAAGNIGLNGVLPPGERAPRGRCSSGCCGPGTVAALGCLRVGRQREALGLAWEARVSGHQHGIAQAVVAKGTCCPALPPSSGNPQGRWRRASLEMERGPEGPPDPPLVVPGKQEAGLVASGAREEESGRDGMPGVWVPNTSRLPGAAE